MKSRLYSITGLLGLLLLSFATFAFATPLQTRVEPVDAVFSCDLAKPDLQLSRAEKLKVLSVTHALDSPAVFDKPVNAIATINAYRFEVFAGFSYLPRDSSLAFTHEKVSELKQTASMAYRNYS